MELQEILLVARVVLINVKFSRSFSHWLNANPLTSCPFSIKPANLLSKKIRSIVVFLQNYRMHEISIY